jgi:shikimate kinase
VTVRVVLVGLPGVGKSTVGRALAAHLEVPFVDVDDLIAVAAGRSAAAVLREQGEVALREAEARALDDALGRPGPLVLATGGGAVEAASSRALLAGASLVVLLEAPPDTLLERLDGGDRPLVAGPTSSRLAALAAHRAPLYAEVADATVDASGTVDETVAALARLAHPA